MLYGQKEVEAAFALLARFGPKLLKVRGPMGDTDYLERVTSERDYGTYEIHITFVLHKRGE